jgi:formylglycine-generating enzyme required for sulfatase activity
MYMMKGEISQSQWVAFFNTLTTGQKSTRDITSSTGKNTDSLSSRNSVSWTSGDATLPDRGGGATYTGVAMNFISWADLTAYLDWSGLRPMSELEFEKAGRGPNAAIAGEYAWGSTSLTNATSVTNLGLISERGQAGSNALITGGVSGPMRVGSFAKGVTTRVDSGAGFYGVMELSGNLWERPVTVGNSTGRAFDGRYHGNGLLNATGDADVTTWPGTGATGAGYRGGAWFNSAVNVRLSDRDFAASTSASRNSGGGGRGVRSQPLWTPSLASPAIWLDAADHTTITIATGVSQWNDKSGNGYHVAQATGTQQPTRIAGFLNGLPIHYFDGANDFMDRAAAGATGTTTSSIIAVFRMRTGGPTQDIPMGIGGPTSNAARALYRAASGTTVGFGGWGNDITTSGLSFDISGGYHLFGFVQTSLTTPNNVTLIRDGTTEVGTTVANLIATVDGFTVGSLRGGSVGTYYTDMNLCEILVFYTALSTANRQLVEGYLAWKWGLQANLPAGHPFLNRPPLRGD